MQDIVIPFYVCAVLNSTTIYAAPIVNRRRDERDPMNGAPAIL